MLNRKPEADRIDPLPLPVSRSIGVSDLCHRAHRPNKTVVGQGASRGCG
ncbi:MAG: hypothetical protein ACRYGR_08370 [Janthinobacterium lividum]